MKTIILFAKELVDRLKSKSPKFWKKLRYVAGGAAALIVGANTAQSYDLLTIPEGTSEILDNALLVLSGVFGSTFVAKDDTNDDGDGGPGPGGEPPKPPTKP